MLKKLRSNKGFTLVEVIVVAVIVAVLALVAIQLYQGYTREARQNASENLAASAAGFLQSAINADETWVPDDNGGTELAGGDSWRVTLPTTSQVTVFTCPANATVSVSGTGVTAQLEGQSQTSSTYDWR